MVCGSFVVPCLYLYHIDNTSHHKSMHGVLTSCVPRLSCNQIAIHGRWPVVLVASAVVIRRVIRLSHRATYYSTCTGKPASLEGWQIPHATAHAAVSETLIKALSAKHYTATIRPVYLESQRGDA